MDNFEKDEIVSEMKALIEKINVANFNYYVLDKPTISDKEWDEMYYRLLDLEKESGIVLENSPSQKVGGEVLAGFNKVVHKHKVYSLSKAQNNAELLDWLNRNKNMENFEEEFSVEYKYDGLSLLLEYNEGKLQRVSTRGNGEIGEDVTAQAKTVRTIPLSIPYKDEIVIHGEGIMRLSELEKYNKSHEDKLKNARNAVAGAIRNLDTSVTAERKLDFFAYDIDYAPHRKFESQTEIYQFLKEQGFAVGGLFTIAHTLAEIETIIEQTKSIKNSLDYLIDGMVIKINKTAVRDRLGFTEKVPRWAVAFKFEAEETSTTLEGITWQVGRTGKITPVAELESVELCGVTIRRATLNNYNDILRKKLKLGDRVFIRRSNEVIPEVLAVAESFDTSKPIEKPKLCPCCNSVLEDTGTELYCNNHLGCKKQIINKLAQFCSRNAMNIDGLSIKTIEALYEKFSIKTFSDLYKITAEQLLTLDGFKDKKVKNILSGIDKSRLTKLSNFIFALGIEGIGVKTARQLAEHFGSLENLKNASFDELVSMSDIAEITANAILHYFGEDFNLAELDELLNFVSFESLSQKVEGFFTGKKFVLTGTLSKYSRQEAEQLIENQGGKTSSSVTKLTDFVLVGENPGSKLDKARSLNIPIMSEEEFEKHIFSQKN